MARGLNKVQIIGNLGADPEIRNAQDGRAIASFRLATSEEWRDKQSGEKREKTEWVNVVVFNEGLVNVVRQYLKKGSRVYVEGKLQTRKWQDQSGQDRYTTEVVLQAYRGELLMLSGQGDGAGAGGAANGGQRTAAPASNAVPAQSRRDEMDDEIPF